MLIAVQHSRHDSHEAAVAVGALVDVARFLRFVIPLIPVDGAHRPAPDTEEELAELFDLFGYGTPLWGTGLLPTGDETPLYPFVFGGVGLMALLGWLITGRKKRKAR